MVLTLIGDSLTAGNLGIPYTRFLTLPVGTEVRNHGRDGDTARGVRRRIDDVLRADGPEALVIEVGANDLLLPEMARRGGDWTAFVEAMAAQGSVPTPQPREFGAVYAEILDAAAAWGVPRVLCATIPPVGENLSSERNRRRSELNSVIRRVAAEYGAAVILLAEAFEDALAPIDIPSDFFFGEPGDFAADVRRQRRERGAASISEERGLYFTMDGAHLNERGAALAASVISEALASG